MYNGTRVLPPCTARQSAVRQHAACRCWQLSMLFTIIDSEPHTELPARHAADCNQDPMLLINEWCSSHCCVQLDLLFFEPSRHVNKRHVCFCCCHTTQQGFTQPAQPSRDVCFCCCHTRNRVSHSQRNSVTFNQSRLKPLQTQVFEL